MQARDLYALIRTTLRHPDEPFILSKCVCLLFQVGRSNTFKVIPPRDILGDDGRRLTTDLKLRSGASLHLAWTKEASNKAKNEPALNEGFLRASKELPKPAPPNAADYREDNDDGSNGKGDGKDNSGSKGAKGDIEKKLKGLLRLGKK